MNKNSLSILFLMVTIYGFSKPLEVAPTPIAPSFSVAKTTIAVIEPSLGTYPDLTIATVGGNSTVTPDVAPTDATTITGYTDTNFKGKITVSPITGVVNITNAYPAGTYTVTVNAGAGILKTFSITVGNPLCSFRPSLPSPGFVVTSDSHYGNKIGDFNNDGHQDYVTYSRLTSSSIFRSIYIYFGDGMGGFILNTTSNITGIDEQSNKLHDLIVDDFTGDGFLDVAVTYGNCNNAYGRFIEIFKGDGAGSLVTVYKSEGFSTFYDCYTDEMPLLKSADLNNDGIKDIVIGTSNENPGSGSSYSLFSRYFIGTGDGQFSYGESILSYETPSGNIAIGDFNQDNKTDLFTNNQLVSNGAITALDANSEIPGGYLRDGVVGDFNGDGDQDLVGLNGESKLYVLLGTNIPDDATFGSPNEIVVAPSTFAIAVGDLNGDGYQDIVSGGLNNVTIHYGNGDGAFGTSISLAVTGQVYTLSLADFNEDGYTDLFVNGTVLILETPKMKVLGKGIAIATGNIAPTKVNNTDFEGVVNGTTKANEFTITTIGEATLSSIEITGVDAASFSITGIDLSSPVSLTANGSKTFGVTFNPALYATGVKKAMIQINYSDAACYPIDFEVQGTALICSPGTFPISASDIVVPTGVNPIAIVKGDFNEDGKEDIATVFLSNVVAISLGDGNGGFSTTTEVPLVLGSGFNMDRDYIKIEVGDFNGDGHLDLAIPTFDTKITLLYGDGLGGVPTRKDIQLIGSNGVLSSSEIRVGEFNGDGIPDFGVIVFDRNTLDKTNIILSTSSASYTVSVLTEISDGFNLPRFSKSSFLIIEDFDKDGFQDMVGNSEDPYTSNKICFMKGTGNGTFSFDYDSNITELYNFALSEDFNNDGNMDIITFDNNTVNKYNGDGTGKFVKLASSNNWDFSLVKKVGFYDFNGDGNKDIIFPLWELLNVTYGDDAGGFGTNSDFTINYDGDSEFTDVSIGDFNNDGVQDVVTTNVLGLYFIPGDKGVEINLQGNATTIVSGDTTPSVTDATDFGDVTLNTAIIKTYTIQNTGNSALAISSIDMSGTDNTDFVVGGITLPATIAAGTNSTFTLTFSSASSGEKTATVTLENDDCDEGTYTYAVKGSVECSTMPSVGITNNDGVTVLTCTQTSISVTATGGDSYAWDKGLGNSATASITAAGTYTVTVTSANGCTNTKSIVITEDKTIPTAGIINNTGVTVLSCTQTSISVTATGGNTYAWDKGLGNSAAASITAAGTYTVTVTSANGCVDTKSIVITEDKTIPTAGITNNTGVTVLSCTQPSISVTATGGNTYAWDKGLGNSAAASITAPGTYTVTVTSANGCSAMESIIVTENTNFILTYIASIGGAINGVFPQTVSCNESGSIVEAVANTGYVFVDWSDGVTTNSRTDTNITQDITVTANFKTVLDVPEFEVTKFRIYPNPVKEYLTISLENRGNIKGYEIFDISGKRVLFNLNSNLNSIQVSTLQSGLYIIKLKTDKTELVGRFIKE
jgi:hypothetical protein